jgi:isochorismate synthase
VNLKMTAGSVSYLDTSQEKTFLVKSLFNKVVNKGNSIAFWRMPNEQKQQLLISESSKVLSSEKSLEELPEGFMIAPFEAKKRTFLQADYYFVFHQDKLARPDSQLETNSHTWLHEQKFTSAITPSFYISPPTKSFDASQSSFTRLVAQGISLVEQGIVEKVVPSRTKSISSDFDLIEAFEKLCIRYPNAMISLISTPEHGTWLGASPETLVSIEDNRIFKTVALAGTKAWSEGLNSKNVAWTQKEIEEQALVERYIIGCFKKIRLRDYEEHGPKTIIAGNLMHLKSDFTVDMVETNFPQLGSTMLNLLHPTSAVCGMPKEPALEFLLNQEGYDRELYSGYIGPVNLQNKTHLFVNLRCLQWKKSSAILYAGAGVTVDSDPHKEWEETEMKMKTLESVIHNTTIIS